MPLLDTAAAVYAGTSLATKVYMGSTLVWPPVPAKLVFPGVAGNYLTTLNSSALQITGDIEIVARASAADWTPASNSEILTKYATAGNQRGYRMYIALTTGKLVLAYAVDGTGATVGTVSSPTTPSFVDGTMYWLKITRVVSTGVVSFFWAADASTEPVSWTSLGTTVSQLGSGIHPSTAPLNIGSFDASTNPWNGEIRRVIVRAGVAGATRLDVNWDNANANVLSGFAATSGQSIAAVRTTGNQIIQAR